MYFSLIVLHITYINPYNVLCQFNIITGLQLTNIIIYGIFKNNILSISKKNQWNPDNTLTIPHTGLCAPDAQTQSQSPPPGSNAYLSYSVSLLRSARHCHWLKQVQIYLHWSFAPFNLLNHLGIYKLFTVWIFFALDKRNAQSTDHSEIQNRLLLTHISVILWQRCNSIGPFIF